MRSLLPNSATSSGNSLEPTRKAVGSETTAEPGAAPDLSDLRRLSNLTLESDDDSADQRRLLKQLKMGTMEIVVLSMLSRGDRYGYEISKEVAELTEGYFDFKQGFLYPTLRRLERSSLIEGYWRHSESRGPNRKYYRITDEGTTKLQASLRTWAEFVERLDAVLGNTERSET